MKSWAALLLLTLTTIPAAAADVEAVRRVDANSNNRIDPEELGTYFKARGATDEEAANAVTDALTTFGCPLPCTAGISVAQAADIVDEVFEPKTDEENGAAPACKFLSIKRTVADTVNPRSPENDFPAILSYKRDEHADDPDQLNVLGAVEAFSCTVNGGNPSILNLRFDFGAGLDFDIDGGTPPEASAIVASAPFSFTWIAENDSAPVTKVVATITPKFATDRAFDREVHELALSVAPQSRRFGRAGLRTFLPNVDKPRLIIWWQPSLFFEWADVADAAGNEELAALDATTSRIGVRTDVIVRPGILDERLALKMKGFWRRDTGGDSRSYMESSLTYNLDEDGKAQFTAIYRHGRKPPDFSAKDQWLIGIGIQR